MKINQFAVVDTPFETQLKELATIGFYDEPVQVAHAKMRRRFGGSYYGLPFQKCRTVV